MLLCSPEAYHCSAQRENKEVVVFRKQLQTVLIPSNTTEIEHECESAASPNAMIITNKKRVIQATVHGGMSIPEDLVNKVEA
jgi:hypothetical protein